MKEQLQPWVEVKRAQDIGADYLPFISTLRDGMQQGDLDDQYALGVATGAYAVAQLDYLALEESLALFGSIYDAEEPSVTPSLKAKAGISRAYIGVRYHHAEDPRSSSLWEIALGQYSAVDVDALRPEDFDFWAWSEAERFFLIDKVERNSEESDPGKLEADAEMRLEPLWQERSKLSSANAKRVGTVLSAWRLKRITRQLKENSAEDFVRRDDIQIFADQFCELLDISKEGQASENLINLTNHVMATIAKFGVEEARLSTQLFNAVGSKSLGGKSEPLMLLNVIGMANIMSRMDPVGWLKDKVMRAHMAFLLRRVPRCIAIIESEKELGAEGALVWETLHRTVIETYMHEGWKKKSRWMRARTYIEGVNRRHSSKSFSKWLDQCDRALSQVLGEQS